MGSSLQRRPNLKTAMKDQGGGWSKAGAGWVGHAGITRVVID